MIGNIVGGVISAVVGFTIYPMVKEQVAIAIEQTNPVGASLTLLQLVPQIFLGSICLMSLVVIYQGLRNAGLIGSKYQEDYEEDLREKLIENPNHKQTYYEYVQERIEAQKLIRGRFW